MNHRYQHFAWSDRVRTAAIAIEHAERTTSWSLARALRAYARSLLEIPK